MTERCDIQLTVNGRAVQATQVESRLLLSFEGPVEKKDENQDEGE